MILLCIFIKINDVYNEKKIEKQEEEQITDIINNNYSLEAINETSDNKTSSKGDNYIAVLEIPKIGLKKGLVMATKNFNSINYAVSIDKNSKFPDSVGNFILYAHSGNSKISYFDKLKNLENDDEIRIYYNGLWYTYVVIRKYEVDKTGRLSIYSDNENKYITLTTCSQENKQKQIVILGKEK